LSSGSGRGATRVGFHGRERQPPPSIETVSKPRIELRRASRSRRGAGLEHVVAEAAVEQREARVRDLDDVAAGAGEEHVRAAHPREDIRSASALGEAAAVVATEPHLHGARPFGPGALRGRHADEHVGEPVLVDVAARGASHGARQVADHEAAYARLQVRERHGRGVHLAEHDA